MSGTIADKLSLLANTKAGIKQAIINKGVAVSSDDAFSTYPAKIAAIPTGEGEVITAVNMTGSTAAVGDKVWVNTFTPSAPELAASFTATNTTNSSYSRALMNKNGTRFFISDVNDPAIYSLQDDELRKETEFDQKIPNEGAICYSSDKDEIYVVGSTSYDTYNYELPSHTVGTSGIHYVGQNLTVDTRASVSTPIKLLNGTSLSNSIVAYNRHNFCFCGEYLYWNDTTQSGIGNRYAVDLTNLTVTSDGTYTRLANGIWFIAGTPDGKYIVAASTNAKDYNFYGSQSNNVYLRLVHVTANHDLEAVAQGDMPANMQWAYNTNCHICFNPYNGVLTLAEAGGTAHCIYRYKNGAWSQLNATLDVEGETGTFAQAIQVSQDMQTLMFIKGEQGNSTSVWNVRMYIAHPDFSGQGSYKVAYAFDLSRIDADTITGKVVTGGIIESNIQVATVVV